MAGGVLWDEINDIVKERLSDPLRQIINTFFSIVLTAVDVLRAIVVATGLGGGAIEDWLNSFIARVETEKEGANDEIGGIVGDSLKVLFVQAMALAGVNLDPDEPLSAESITEVVSQLVGYDFENVFDEELLRRDLLGLASQKVEEETGVPIDLADAESIGNFAAALLVGAVQGYVGKLDVSAICPAVNTVGSVLCKTQNCHLCMDDEEACIERRKKQKKNRNKYEKVCTRVARGT